MKKIFRNNGLSITFAVLFIISLVGQIFTGLSEHNKEMSDLGGQEISLPQYISSGHFMQATFENWESEFLQMALFMIFTMFLFQKGSSESKDPDGKNEVDREPNPRKKDAPWAVKKGGWVLTLYKHSLCYTFTLLFMASFYVHLKGSLKDFNEEQVLKHQPINTLGEYIAGSRFWFESFQNWQSEFLSILAMVVFSIFLREQYSSQSKPVDAADSQTGEGG